MNWGLVGWFAGIVATFVGLKFVIVMAKTLFSKESMEDFIDYTGEKISRRCHKISKNIKKKMKEKRDEKKEAKKENTTDIMIWNS